MRRAVLLAFLLCVGLAAADLELKTLQEESAPGESSGTYAIIEDGKMVGMMQRYSASAAATMPMPLQHRMGRRGGPADDAVPLRTAHLMGLIRARMDVIGALHDSLLASRCPYARQMALTRMQAAVAAQRFADELPLPGPKLFGGPEETEQAFADSQRAGRFLPGHGPRMHPHFDPLRPEPFRRHDHPAHPHPLMLRDGGFPARPIEEVMANPSFPRPGMWRGEEPFEGFEAVDAPLRFEGPHGDPRNNPSYPRPMIMREGAGVAWRPLQDTAMPAPGMEPEVNWRFVDDDGSLNWGMVTFVVLAAACAAVWGAMLAQYCSLCSLTQQVVPAFIVRADGFEPLTDDSEDEADPKAALKKRDGLEYAAAYVPAAAQNVAVLQYDSLKK